jgi:hypothetical protein
MGLDMPDPDIEGRLKSLRREHLAALLDFMFGERSRAGARPQHIMPDDDGPGLTGLRQNGPEATPF